MGHRKAKVLVAMSGGVDSSVAAALLLEEGYDVVGCFMRLGSPGETFDEPEPYADGIRIGGRGCCSINDAADARMVAATLGIPFYVCNFKKDFGRVIDYFVSEYNAGRTPNPCVRCNDWLKFGKLHAYAKQIDARFVASGHYARIDRGRRLLRGVDPDKDQSYVLFGTPRERLGAMLLPIGEHRKHEVRRIAEGLGLPVFDKPDSQEICFVPDGDYAGLVRRRAPRAVAAGDIVDTSGGVVGGHAGHQHYTVGQRRGLGLSLGHPVYVVGKDPSANTVTIGRREDLLAGGCRAADANWLVEVPYGERIECAAQIRSNAEAVPGRAVRTGADTLEVRFDEPQFAVAPGQAVVCYDGDLVVCGGWITESLREAR
jgi:tRNA-specific 2-thiouridylase